MNFVEALMRARFWRANLLASRVWRANMLSSRVWRANMLSSRVWRANMLSVCMGALAAFALPPFHVLPVLLVAFPVLLTQVSTSGGAITAAKRGWWFGFGYHLIGLYWITEAILIEAERFWWLVPLAVPALAAVLAVFVAIPVGLTWYAASGWPRILGLAGSWVLADMARQFIATGFPWNPLGSVWAIPGVAGDVMLQPASLASVHGLTLATIILACGPLARWRGRGACVVLLAVWTVFGMNRAFGPSPPEQDVTVVLVQGNVPQGQKWDPSLLRGVFERYLHLTADALREAGPVRVVVIWPETASPYQLETDDAARAAIAEAAGDALVLAGAVRFDEYGRPRNSLFAITGDGTIAGVYDKGHLVPFGEYQPDWFPLGIQVVPGGGFARGPGASTLHVAGLPPMGPLICYEVIFPGQVVDNTDRPGWLVNVTNDAWFGISTGPRQHLAAARLRAVEEGLPLLRAANTGISIGYDSLGHEINRLDTGQTGFRVIPLPGALPLTLFGRFGLLIPALVAISLVLICVFWSRSHPQD